MVEQFSPEDILIDNLSFKLNKGSSYITDRRSVSFWPAGSNVYKPSSGNRVIKFTLNGEDNAWLDPQSVRVFLHKITKTALILENFVLYHLRILSSEECVLLLVSK